MGQRHTGICSIDFLAYESKIRSWNPGFKLFLAFFALFGCIAADSLMVSCYVFLSMTAVTVGLGKILWRRYIPLFFIPGLFLLVSGAAIAVDFSGMPAEQYHWKLGWFYVVTSNEKIWRAAAVMLKALGAVSAMYMAALSTPVSEVLTALSRFPIPRLVLELMHLIYRFIFILLEVYQNMHCAARSRLGDRGFLTALRTFSCLAGNLFLFSMKRANGYYDAMLARGYDGGLSFLVEERRVSKTQKAALACYMLGLFYIWYAGG